MKIAFVPIDNRPVCYTLPKQIATENVEFFMPERKFLGDLTKSANIKEIFNWFENLPQVDAIVMSLDTVAYGGLIPSRRSSDTFEQIKQRIEKLKEILDRQHAKIYAFSSIMRISNNNVNEEEKEYWNKYGKKIFEYSYNLDKSGKTPFNDIPKDILTDYLETRKRNFEINKIYLDWQKERFFDTLVFSKDDCAQFGLNVKEARELESLGGFVKTGADEIPMTLLARAINKNYENILPRLKVAPIFLETKYKNLISNYEDISIEKSVFGQLELAGCEVCNENDADILLYINNFEERQGEIVMGVDTKPFSGTWEKPTKPYIIADVRYANGADNAFVEKLFKIGFDENFLGYSAWNTSANSLGSLICSATAQFQLAKICDDKNKLKVARLTSILTRFLDDWAYQANVRQVLRKYSQNEAEKKIKNLMKPYEDKLFKMFDIKYNANYTFPWNRLFEVEIEFN
jgi:hypothetical protein